MAAASPVPRLVFTSSIAVFGAPFPDAIGDEFLTAPLTSYGRRKPICELLISDYSRKGFVDGMSLRMPTVCVRPGKPNKAASGFFLEHHSRTAEWHQAVLPVDDTVRHWHASPRAAVGFLLQAADMGGAALGNRRALTLPGLSCTVAEQIAALERIAGKKVTALIKRQPDETIRRSSPAGRRTSMPSGRGFRLRRRHYSTNHHGPCGRPVGRQAAITTNICSAPATQL